MIIDYRIYLTIYAMLLIPYTASILFVGRRKWALLFGGSLGAYLVVGLLNYLDWLWS